jgi:hypothetical protein
LSNLIDDTLRQKTGIRLQPPAGVTISKYDGVAAFGNLRNVAISAQTRTDNSIFLRGRACPGHPRLAAPASPFYVDARHKAGHERVGKG